MRRETRTTLPRCLFRVCLGFRLENSVTPSNFRNSAHQRITRRCTQRYAVDTHCTAMHSIYLAERKCRAMQVTLSFSLCFRCSIFLSLSLPFLSFPLTVSLSLSSREPRRYISALCWPPSPFRVYLVPLSADPSLP